MKGFLILSVIFLFSFASVYCQIATQPSDTTICNGDTAIFNISVNGASLSYQWEESIDNGSSWDTLYNGLSYSGVNSDSFSILATTHFYNGNKYRCLVDTNGAQFEISDTATLYIDSLPTAYAGSDQSLCAYDNLLVNDAYNTSSSIIWTHTGIGTLTGTTTISPAYTPDSTESNNIYLILSVTSNNSCGLAMVVDSMRLTIDTIPNAYAGPNDTICASSSFISVQSSGLFSSLFWSASCCGTLQNDSTLNPTFVPDSGQSGIKTLIMTTTCRFDTVRDTMQLTLDTLPTSYAGPNDTTCTATSFFLDQSSGIYSSVLWSASCCGTLLNDSTLNPTLLPDSGQIGNLFLIMTTYCRSDSIKDTMQLTVDTLATAYAGLDTIICTNSTYTVTGASNSNSTILWIHNGAGSLVNDSTLSPTYLPDTAENGNISLFLIASGNNGCLLNVLDTASLTIEPLPVVSAGNDDTICTNSSYTVTGAYNSNSTVLWVHNGAGSLVNDSTLSPTYLPAPAETGTIYLIVAATSNSSCASAMAMDTLTLTIDTLPFAFAGIDGSVCTDDSLTINAANNMYGNISWTHTGLGILKDTATLTPSYVPSTGEKGNIKVILTVTSNNGCGISFDIDSMVLTIDSLPIAYAGFDTSMCTIDSLTITSASSLYANIFWAHNGTGNLVNFTTISPTYAASIGEIGNIDIILTATSNNSCGAATSIDSAVIIIDSLPSLDAGNDDTVCTNSSYTITTASYNYSTLQWSTTGLGLLTNATTITPTYTPTSAETGDVLLILTALSNNFCGVAVAIDSMTLHIDSLPEGDAGQDVTICTSNSYTVISASNKYSTVLWTTNGSGVLSDDNTINPTYTPDSAESGSFLLILTATSNNSCGTATYQDSMTLTIDPLPLVYAGTDTIICNSQSYNVSDAINNFSTVSWTHNGAGNLFDTSTINPTYVPDIGESGIIQIYVVATSNNMCGNATASDSIELTINPLPTADAGIDTSICNGDSIKLTAIGLPGSTFLWDTQDSTASIIVSPSQTTTYSVQVTDTNQCGTESDNIIIRVDLLPTPNIAGEKIVCNNQIDVVYNSLKVLGNSYFWVIDKNYQYLSGENLDEIRVHWSDTLGQALITLKETIDTTGCAADADFNVMITTDNAPNKTKIYRKPNSNILICLDNLVDKYQWGFTEKATNVENSIPNGTMYFHEFTNGIDTNKYYYWVVTGFNSGCETKSYFNSPFNTGVYENYQTGTFEIYPNPSSELIYINIVDQSVGNLSLTIRDLTGRIVIHSMFYKTHRHFSGKIKVWDLYNGIYLVEIRTENGTGYIRKLLIY